MEKCPWLIEVASGNPEPDSYADTVMLVECELPLADGGYGDDTLVCEAGHEFGGMQRRYAPYGPEWQREQLERAEGGC